MSSFKEYWTGSKGGDRQAEQELQKKKAVNSCTDTERDCGSGYICLYGQCEKSTGTTGNQWCPTENNTGGCSGCGDYECKNGIVATDFDGNKICVPKSCSNSSPCPSGYTCVKGTCQKANCNSVKPCASGYFCVNGQCSPDPDDGQCSANIDCPYGQACVGGSCEPDDNIEPPNYGTEGQPCSVYCQQYFQENGQVDQGSNCRERTCDDCDDCSRTSIGSDAGSCVPSNRCECKEARGELGKCLVCNSEGLSVTDCDCVSCSSVSNVRCPCGISLPPQQFCQSVCQDGLVPGSQLNNQIASECNRACENGRDPDECDGICYNITTSSSNYSCPINEVCELVGVITVGANTEYIYKNCDPSRRPAYCENTPQARRHISLSVIDEDDGYDEGTKANDWINYRAAAPDGIFVVLVPNKGNGVVTSPPGFDGTRLSVSLNADWAAVLQGPLANASSCYAFIDNSGSMTVNDVRGSLNQFSAYCSSNGISFNYTSSQTENWIGPHVGFTG